MEWICLFVPMCLFVCRCGFVCVCVSVCVCARVRAFHLMTFMLTVWMYERITQFERELRKEKEGTNRRTNESSTRINDSTNECLRV